MRPSWIQKVLVGVALSSVLGTYALAQSGSEEAKRKVKTKVIVQDGETISLAGLISDKKFRQNTGIPLLQEIPVRLARR